jgi:hypothetical protein
MSDPQTKAQTEKKDRSHPPGETKSEFRDQESTHQGAQHGRESTNQVIYRTATHHSPSSGPPMRPRTRTGTEQDRNRKRLQPVPPLLTRLGQHRNTARRKSLSRQPHNQGTASLGRDGCHFGGEVHTHLRPGTVHTYIQMYNTTSDTPQPPACPPAYLPACHGKKPNLKITHVTPPGAMHPPVPRTRTTTSSGLAQGGAADRQSLRGSESCA